jgi:hypothetical protein
MDFSFCGQSFTEWVIFNPQGALKVQGLRTINVFVAMKKAKDD